MNKEEKVIYWTIADGTGFEKKKDIVVFGFIDGGQYAFWLENKVYYHRKFNCVKDATDRVQNTFAFIEQQGVENFKKYIIKGKGEKVLRLKDVKPNKRRDKKLYKEKGVITVYSKLYEIKKVPYSFYKNNVK